MSGMVTVGGLVINMSADTAQLKTDMAEGMRAVDGGAKSMINSMTGVTEASGRVTDAGARMIAQLQQEIATFGMTSEQLAKQKANMAGVGVEYEALTQRLASMKAAQAAFTTEVAVTSSAVQTHSAAVKEASAATHSFSLASASARTELLVLAHELSQGNTTRFSQSMMVLGEKTGIASALFSSAGLAVLGLGAAVIGVGSAIAKGAQEQREMSNALIATGNYAGLTSESLNALAHASVTAGGSLGEAKKTVIELASTGKFTGQQIGLITEAAVAMEHAGGQSIEKTIDAFKSLAVEASGSSMRTSEAISKAAVKLDEEYHFLTESVYEQIRALEKEGDQKAASALATETLAKVTKDRAEEMKGNIGSIQSGWNSVKEAIGGAVDALGNFGKKATLQDPIDRYKGILQDMDARPGWLSGRDQGGSFQAQFDESRMRIVKALTAAVIEKNNAEAAGIKQGKDAAAQQEAVLAASRIEQDNMKLGKKSVTELDDAIQKYGQDLAKIAAANPTSKLLDQSVVDEHMAMLRAAHTAKPITVTGQDDRAAVLQAALATEQTALDREKSIYDARDKMLDLYHSKFGMADSAFYQGREAARAEYLAAETITFAKESALLEASRAAARNPQEVAAAKEKYAQLVKAHDKFVDDMRNASGQDAAGAEAAAQQQYDDMIKATLNAGAASIKSLDDQIAKQREHNAEIGKTKEQIELAKQAQVDLDTVQLQADADYLRDGLAKWNLDEKARAAFEIRLNNLDDEIARRRTLAGLLNDGAVREADAKAAADAAAAWKKAANTIENDLTNAILDGGGKGWKKLVRDIEMAFAKMVLSPILEPVSGGLATALTPFMGNQTISGPAGGAVGLAQTASNLYGLATGGMTLSGGLGTGFMGSLAGGLNGAGVGSGLTSSIGLQIGNSIADVVGPSVSGAIASGLGTVATALPWIGAAVAAVSIGKAAFGMGPKQTTDMGISGTLSDSGVTGQSYTDWTKKGGWFRSDKHGQDTAALSADTVKQFTQGLSSLETSAAGFATALGVSADSITGYSKSFNIKLTGDAAKDQQAVTDFFTGVGDELAKKLVPNLDTFSKSGESASAALQRLAGDFQATTTVAQLLGKTAAEAFGSAGVESAAARERLVSLAGGASNLTSEAQSYAQAYLTDAEKLAPVTKAVDAAMQSLGLSAVTTRAQFKAVVDGLDLTSEAGAKEFASLMSLADAFAQVHPQIDAVAVAATAAADAVQAMKDSATGLLGDVDNAFTVLQNVTKTTTDAISKRITAEQALSSAVKSTLSSMTAVGVDMSTRAAAQAQIKAAVASVKAGGALPDAASLQSALSTVSKDASAQFKTYADYLKDLYSTKNDVSQLGDAADAALSVDQKQLDSLQAMLDAAQQQVNLLKGIDTTGLSIEQALAGFQGALLGAQKNPINAANQAINEAYHSSLGRAPDSDGLAFYQQAAANGGSIADITSSIANSPEAQVQKLYKSLLGRQADAAGLQFYVNSGESMSQIAADIKSSAEYKAKVPGFAVGGDFGGGWRVVGENGPELEATGPARIFNASQTSSLFSRLASPSENSMAIVSELKSLRSENQQLRAMMESHLYAIAKYSMTTAGALDGASTGARALYFTATQ